MATNRFVQLKNAGQLLEVEMDTAKILLPGGPPAIGTRNLNSCSGLVILGEDAIIIAHIAPLPPHPLGASNERVTSPGEGEAHFRSVLNEVQELYVSHRAKFPSRTASWAVFGRFEGVVAMPEKLAIAKRAFASLGIPMRFALYDIAKASERGNPAAGTVVGVMRGRKVYLFVEDQLKDCIDFNQPTGTASAPSSGPSQTASAHQPQLDARIAAAQSLRTLHDQLLARGLSNAAAVEALVASKVKDNPQADKTRVRSGIVDLLNFDAGVTGRASSLPGKPGQGTRRGEDDDADDDDDEGDDDEGDDDDDEGDDDEGDDDSDDD